MSALADHTGVSAETLEAIARGAAALDADPAFPADALAALAADGALALTAQDEHPGRAREWAAVRAVARADGSAGRIFEGHLNGVERIAVAAPEPLRSAELAAVRDGRLLLGVWGADPTPAEGEPARLVETSSGLTLTALDRARRDFEPFVLQHRLDPMVARLGREALS